MFSENVSVSISCSLIFRNVSISYVLIRVRFHEQLVGSSCGIFCQEISESLFEKRVWFIISHGYYHIPLWSKVVLYLQVFVRMRSRLRMCKRWRTNWRKRRAAPSSRKWRSAISEIHDKVMSKQTRELSYWVSLDLWLELLSASTYKFEIDFFGGDNAQAWWRGLTWSFEATIGRVFWSRMHKFRLAKSQRPVFLVW